MRTLAIENIEIQYTEPVCRMYQNCQETRGYAYFISKSYLSSLQVTRPLLRYQGCTHCGFLGYPLGKYHLSGLCTQTYQISLGLFYTHGQIFHTAGAPSSRICSLSHHLQINNCVFTFASELWQNNARALRFWCVKCTNLKGECIGQVSKLKRECIILSQFSSTK